MSEQGFLVKDQKEQIDIKLLDSSMFNNTLNYLELPHKSHAECSQCSILGSHTRENTVSGKDSDRTLYIKPWTEIQRKINGKS